MVDAPPPAAPPVVPPTAPNPQEQNAWMAGFNEDQKGYVQTKGYKGPADLVDAYRNAEKLLGVPADRVLKLPEKFDAPEMRAIYERLGMPKDAKEYGIIAPKEGGDPKLTEAFVTTFHEAGVSKSAAEKIVGKWNEFQVEKQKQIIADANAKYAQDDAALKKEWGAAYDQNINLGKEAVRVMGLTKEQVNAVGGALGFKGLSELLLKLGSATREDVFIGGGSIKSQILAPEAAKHQIKALINDMDFGRRLQAGEKEATDKWTALHQMASPGERTF